MSKNFNPDDYETVKERKKRFYGDYPDGRVDVDMVENTDVKTVMKVILYKNREDLALGLFLSKGHAQEIKGQGGFANNNSWTENCEESAFGRALDNAGYSGNNKCSREEMIQARENAKVLKEHEDLFQRIVGLIAERTENFKDKTKVTETLEKLGVKNSEEIKRTSIERKHEMLGTLGDLTMIGEVGDIDSDFPVPQEEREKGPDYRFTNGKFKGQQMKDVDLDELADYSSYLHKQVNLNPWEVEARDYADDYIENREMYQDILAEQNEGAS